MSRITWHVEGLRAVCGVSQPGTKQVKPAFPIGERESQLHLNTCRQL